MIKIKCDFCGKEILFENIQDVLNDNIRKDIKYYVACQDCGEKIRNLIISDKFGIITFMNGDKSRDMTEHEQEVYDNILKENAKKTGIVMF